MREPSIEIVKKYWESHPLLSIELDTPIGSREYFSTHEQLTDEVFAYSKSIWKFDECSEKKVLDVGCGPGYFVRNYARNGADIIGVDLTKKAVELTNKSLKMFDLKGQAVEANAEELPFADNSFDMVVSCGVLHHTPNTQKAINEIYRVVKPDGTTIVSLYYKNILMSKFLWPFTRAFIKIFFGNVKGRGFRDITTVEDLVRVYDGDNNPLGKAYSRREIKRMFSNFKVKQVGLYYFPTRFLKKDSILYGLMKPFGKLLDRSLGLMIWIEVIKK